MILDQYFAITGRPAVVQAEQANVHVLTSPFSTALVERLPMPGLDLRKVFGFVRDDVLKNTGYKQEPYVYGSLGGDDVPLVPAKPAATGPQASPDSEIRRDYELALQLGNRDVWTAFLNRYPSGFYTDLAKAQLNRIAAEEARAAAADKARQAEDEKARLAADRAKKTEQDKAAAAAKVPEDTRLAAEKAKQIEEAKAAASEQRRKDAEAAVAKAVADKQAAEKALADKVASNKTAAELAAKQKADKKAQVESEQKVAAIADLPRAEFLPSGDSKAGAIGATSRRLPLRRCGWRLECIVAAVALDVQQVRWHEVRRQARELRRPRSHQGQGRSSLPASLRPRFQG